MLFNKNLGIAIGEIENVYEEADVKQVSVKLNFCLRVQFFLFPEYSSMIFREFIEDRSAKTKRFTKFGYKHFNYKLERDNQQKQDTMLNELKSKLEVISKRLDDQKNVIK